MNDKFYLESLLTEVKSLSNLLFTATTEATNECLHQKLQTGLNICLQWQYTIYKHMEEMGYYNVENVDKQAIVKEQTNIKPIDFNCTQC